MQDVTFIFRVIFIFRYCRISLTLCAQLETYRPVRVRGVLSNSRVDYCDELNERRSDDVTVGDVSPEQQRGSPVQTVTLSTKP